MHELYMTPMGVLKLQTSQSLCGHHVCLSPTAAAQAHTTALVNFAFSRRYEVTRILVQECDLLAWLLARVAARASMMCTKVLTLHT